MGNRSGPLPLHFTGRAISAATPRKSDDSRNTVKIKTRALVDLAETVKSKRTPVPAVILKDLEQVVQYRREFASWYELKGTETEPPSNTGHQFFIGVCEKVHQLLASSEAPAPARAGSKKGKRAASSSTVDAALLDKTVRNLFAQLKVDEPSASPLGQAPKRNTQLPKEHASVILESDQREDYVFAIWCHLQDMRDVRELVTQTWQSFANGDVTLIAAALVLEVGLILLHSADTEFVHGSPQFGSWYAVADALGIMVRNIGPRTANKSMDLLSPHYSFLDLMGESIAELLYHSKKQNSRIERSEFIIGLVKYSAGQSEAMSTGLVVSYEIYCAIFQMIGSCPEIAARTYLYEMAPLNESVIKYRTLLGQAQYPTRPRTGNWSIELDNALEAYTSWPFDTRGQDGRYSTDESKSRPRMRTLLHLPCAMGNLLFSSKIRIHKAGLDIAGDLQQGVIMAHLYTAMRRYGILKAAWHDMDLVLAQQKSVQPLFPKLSTDPFAIVKHFLVALGTPAFAGGQLPKPPPESVVGPCCRRLQEPSLFLQNMDKRHDEARFKRQKLIEVVLNTMTEKARTTAPGKNSQNQIVGTMPVELLSTFKKSFISDEPQLNFDYFGFWMSCHSIFRKILTDDNIYDALEREKAAKDELDLCYVVVYHLLLGAAKAVSRGKPIQGLPINAAAELMEAFISSSGNEYSQAAFRVSSGRIPKDMRLELREWTPRKPSGAAAILSQDPASTLVGTASLETIYDPNGCSERFEIAKRLEKDIYAAAREKGATEWSEMMYKGAPWRYGELDVD
ncbi:hypothetical protein TI39_contig415g00023 [Zymoseptoria brevis]|uniref:DUF6604 domain-containing protein n=1 Tax=Zymoseptoria brevis TaxID=1047168 RepID=A0A0F4GM80_9PEZI|nr:hypothetical protein TI39_contig415g00023 [Zymoseptoria brevis]